MRGGAPRREPLVDALRGLALFGVLAINLQGYVLGVNGAGLGFLDAAASAADHATVVLLACFVQYKFYPLFCFCFGYGFAVQTRRWRAQGAIAELRFRRRTNFMLGTGVLHGVFLWFGDVLTSYAIAARLLAAHIGKGPKALRPVLRVWLVATLVVAVPVTALLSWAVSESPADVRAAVERSIAVYASGPYWASIPTRIGDFLAVTYGFLLTGAQVVLIMLAGAWCAHAGVLRRPARHRRFWRQALKWGLLVGVSMNLVFAAGEVATARDVRGAWQTWALLSHGFVAMLSVAYVAALALNADRPQVARLIALAAPAGRYALTHYLTQSLLMLWLLGGIGLGLGASLRQAELLAVAIVVFALQLALSHAWARRNAAGPLESLWRRYTYGPAHLRKSP